MFPVLMLHQSRRPGTTLLPETPRPNLKTLCMSDAGSSPDDLFEDQTQPAARSNASFEAQMSVLRETLQSSVQAALLQQRSHPQHFGLPSLTTTVPSRRAPGTATPLGLNRPLDKNLEDRILRGLPDAYASQTAHSPTSAAGASLPVTPSAPALNARPVVVPGIQATATAARSEGPLLSTPIDVDRLQLELSDHPDRDYVDSLIHMLRFGARIAYTGPRRPRLSRNLISASQHSDIVSDNLAKEVKLGRVAGPFLTPTLPDLQCHL